MPFLKIPANPGLVLKPKKKVNSSDSSGLFEISGTPSELRDANVQITIPFSYINNRTSDVRVDTKQIRYKITNDTMPYAYIPTNIEANFPLNKESISDVYTITLENVGFKSFLDGEDISSWLIPHLDGIKMFVKGDTAKDSKTLKFYLKGILLSPIKANNIVIAIHKSNLTEFPTDTIDKNLFVDVPSFIINSETYSWTLYDIAAFGDIKRTIQNANRSLTTYGDGSDIVYENDGTSLILSGKDGESVNIPKGLKRYGYIFKGFAVKKESENNLNKAIVYKVEDIVKNDSINFTPTLDNDNIILYAMWEQDYSLWGWTKNADGSYKKTNDTSEGGLYLPPLLKEMKL